MTTIDSTSTSVPVDDIDAEVTAPAPHALDDAPRPTTSIMIALDDIVERDGYTRDVNPMHAQHLANSIDEIGLEQPLVLMPNNFLIAGRHRYHALLLLRTRNPERFGRMFPDGIPAQVIDLGERPRPEDILAVEMTENNARLEFTDQEVARAVDALTRQGYTCKRGRPGKGDRPIGPVLMKMFGMSEATLRRALATARRGENVSPDRFSQAKPRGRKPKPVNQNVDGGQAPAQVENDADPSAAAQLQALDRVAEARAAVEAMTGEELTQFAAWLAGHQAQRDDD